MNTDPFVLPHLEKVTILFWDDTSNEIMPSKDSNRIHSFSLDTLLFVKEAVECEDRATLYLALSQQAFDEYNQMQMFLARTQERMCGKLFGRMEFILIIFITIIFITSISSCTFLQVGYIHGYERARYY
jgi:hypothetical protein